MKRSDLYHRNITKTRRTLNIRTSRKKVDQSQLEQHIFPLMHRVQFLICILLFIFVFSYRNSISDTEVSTFFNVLQYHLDTSIDLQPSEWSGTLKDILIIRK